MTNNDFNPKLSNKKASKISMLVSGIFMGNIGILFTLLELSGYSAYSIILFRGIFGVMFLSLLMLKRKSFSIDFIRESFTHHLKPLILSGFFFSLMGLLYLMSISISGYAISAFLLYTSGIYVLLLLYLTKQEKISRQNVFCFVLAIIGIAIIMEFWKGEIFTIGIIIGLLSGFAYGTSVFYKKKIYIQREKNKAHFHAKGDFDTFFAWFSTLFYLMFLPFGILEVFKLTLIDIFYCLLLGFFPTALAFILYNHAVKKDKGGDVIILSYFEPVMATINAAIFAQNLSFFTILGGSIILLANILMLKLSNSQNNF